MAHDLNYNSKRGTYSFAGVKEQAWHKLGTIVDTAMTSEEAIRLANLDYDVVKVPNFASIPLNWDYPEDEQDFVRNPATFSTVRTDNNVILGSVGRDYTVVNNSDAFQFFDDITKAKEAMFETAGALGNGEQIFISAKLPKYIKVGDDVVEQYLLFFNSHDGSKSIEIMFTPVRVVCNNTLTYARQTAKNKYRIRHTKSAHDRLNIAAEAMNIQNKLMLNATDVYNAMAKTKLDKKGLLDYTAKVFMTANEYHMFKSGVEPINYLSGRKRNILNDVMEYAHSGVGQDTESAKGTVWGAYNAITGYYQNKAKYKDEDAKMKAIVEGVALNTGARAFAEAEALLYV